MSFPKIKDPSKRYKLVAEYIKTKNKIQNDFRSEQLVNNNSTKMLEKSSNQ